VLTVAKYQTASGKKIQDVAVLPNVLVGKQTAEDEDEDEATPAQPQAPAKNAADKDEFLDKALQQFKSK